MTIKPEAYYDELDRAYRAQPGTAAFIMERAMAKFDVTRAEINADLIARFGAAF